MKKLLIGTALVGALGFASPTYADQINEIDGFAGGCEIYTTAGAYCIISSNDIGASFICAVGYAAKTARLNVAVYTCNNTGWGCQTYGSNSCTNVYAW